MVIAMLQSARNDVQPLALPSSLFVKYGFTVIWATGVALLPLGFGWSPSLPKAPPICQGRHRSKPWNPISEAMALLKKVILLLTSSHTSTILYHYSTTMISPFFLVQSSIFMVNPPPLLVNCHGLKWLILKHFLGDVSHSSPEVS